MEEGKLTESLIAVTGAGGHLGRLVIEALLSQGVPASGIVALVRDPRKASELASRGVVLREADYERPETLDTALRGVGRLLLISGNEVGRRLSQHENVISAAQRAGVQFIAYTSILNADRSGMQLVAEHRATEGIIRDSGIAHVILRNGWYFENYNDVVKQALSRGVIMGSAGDGRVSAASRSDYAGAAAAVLTGEGHENRVYELGGDQAFTMRELASEVARQGGVEVVYQDMPADAYQESLVGYGLPGPFARVLADSDQGIRRGDLYTDSNDLAGLIGRPPTRLEAAVGAALA